MLFGHRFPPYVFRVHLGSVWTGTILCTPSTTSALAKLPFMVACSYIDIIVLVYMFYVIERISSFIVKCVLPLK